MKKSLLLLTTLFIYNLGFSQDATEVKNGYKYNNKTQPGICGRIGAGLELLHFGFYFNVQ